APAVGPAPLAPASTPTMEPPAPVAPPSSSRVTTANRAFRCREAGRGLIAGSGQAAESGVCAEGLRLKQDPGIGSRKTNTWCLLFSRYFDESDMPTPAAKNVAGVGPSLAPAKAAAAAPTTGVLAAAGEGGNGGTNSNGGADGFQGS